ncbi:hypothetical protein PNB23_12435, partial [Enterococcus faecium]|nr:hypothetical protein [Enterococcus faecium]MDB7388109.1 hypothetical protein [Enterococcus faecium]MDB7550263.1 hypothetical protein [Enterococcus faecium]MDB7565904.1 hypothetical protein [Enterococcus faecium]
KDDQILTTQDIIFFSLGVSDISQGQADEYVSQLEELIQKYNETFDAFMAEIKGRVDSLNQQITDLTGQAKTLQEKLDALKEEISKLGNLQVMYSNSIDFGNYDYSGNPNLMIPLKASNFYTQSGVTVEDAGNALKVTFTKTDGAVFLESIENVPALVPNTQYTLSAEVTVSEGYAGKLENLRIGYRKGPTGTIILPLTCKEAIVGQKTRISITANSSALTDPSKFDRMYFTINTTSTDPFVGTVLIENIKVERGSTATEYQPNLLDAPYYLSKVPLGENIFKPASFPINTTEYMAANFTPNEPYVQGQKYTFTMKASKPSTQTFGIYLRAGSLPVGDMVPVEGLADVWQLTFEITQSHIDGRADALNVFQMPQSTKGTVTIEWAKLEKGDTRTPNIEQYKYLGIGMRDSNNPKDFVWDLAPKYVEENLATESKVTEIIGEANKYTDNSIEAVNINVTNIADDLAKQINVNENAARNYTDTKKIEAVNESKKYTDEVFRKEIVNLTVKNGNLGTARLYRQGNCVTIYFFDLNGRNSGGNDSVILTVPEGYRTPISFEQLVGSTDRSAFNNAQLGFGADGNIYWRRNTSYASSYTFAVTYII